jgi:hypothetical protein
LHRNRSLFLALTLSKTTKKRINKNMSGLSEKYLVVGTDGKLTAPVSEEAGPWWKTTKQRLVRAFFPSTLKSGTQVKFQDGTIYQTQLDGSLRRISPLKPWRNKAEHKAHKKKRRRERDGVFGSYDDAAKEVAS